MLRGGRQVIGALLDDQVIGVVFVGAADLWCCFGGRQVNGAVLGAAGQWRCFGGRQVSGAVLEGGRTPEPQQYYTPHLKLRPS